MIDHDAITTEDPKYKTIEVDSIGASKIKFTDQEFAKEFINNEKTQAMIHCLWKWTPFGGFRAKDKDEQDEASQFQVYLENLYGIGVGTNRRAACWKFMRSLQIHFNSLWENTIRQDPMQVRHEMWEYD